MIRDLGIQQVLPHSDTLEKLHLCNFLFPYLHYKANINKVI